MKVEPFYCKTEGLTAQQVQDVLDKCVDLGVKARDFILEAKSRHDSNFMTDLYQVNRYPLFGVERGGTTYVNEQGVCWYGAIELTYDQIDAHLGLMPTETPEEKEALDAIKPVSNVVNIVDVGFGLMEGAEKFLGTSGLVVGEHKNKHGYDLVIVEHECGSCIAWRKEMIETPQQREERERLEAAYDLYVDWCRITELPKFNLRDFSCTELDKKSWLEIVDKTGYRKVSDA